MYKSKVDKAYGKKLKALNAREKKIAQRRLKEFTAISPANKKTRWYY
jgi:hypothetical protein